MDFEPIARIFDIRGQICKKRMETAQSTNKYKDKTPKEVADIIMKQDAPKADAASVAGGQKLRGMDLAFYTTVAEIFGNYDPEVIRRQNNDIVKNCLKGLWNWRDKQTGETFRLAVDAALAEDRQKGQKSDSTDDARADIAFIKEEYEREYTELINEVTEAEHKLAANQNILLETKDLILKYGDLMRKGRLYLLSFIGAVLAIVAAVLPFIYIQVNFSGENLLHKILYLVFTAGFAALYAVACLIYSRKLTKKKRLLTEELEKLKEKSESERRESIAALYTYYSHTVVETESHCLLWREILRRDSENAKKGIKRNNHKKRLERLAGLVERFMTMMKLGDADAVTDAPYDPRDLCLTAEESFHSPDNQRVYGILSEQEDSHKNGIEEGGEA